MKNPPHSWNVGRLFNSSRGAAALDCGSLLPLSAGSLLP
jgi:hypothetical protein